MDDKTYNFPLNEWLDDEEGAEHLSRELDVSLLDSHGQL